MRSSKCSHPGDGEFQQENINSGARKKLKVSVLAREKILFLILACVVLLIAGTACFIIDSYPYPDSKNPFRPKDYGFTKASNVRRATNELSGINIGNILDFTGLKPEAMAKLDWFLQAILDRGMTTLKKKRARPNSWLSGRRCRIDTGTGRPRCTSN